MCPEEQDGCRSEGLLPLSQPCAGTLQQEPSEEKLSSTAGAGAGSWESPYLAQSAGPVGLPSPAPRHRNSREACAVSQQDPQGRVWWGGTGPWWVTGGRGGTIPRTTLHMELHTPRAALQDGHPPGILLAQQSAAPGSKLEAEQG